MQHELICNTNLYATSTYMQHISICIIYNICITWYSHSEQVVSLYTRNQANPEREIQGMLKAVLSINETIYTKTIHKSVHAIIIC